MQISFTDAERAFADSAEGRNAVARAKMMHDQGQAWRGRDAAPWTDRHEADAVRSMTTERARNAVQSAAFMADVERQAPILDAERVSARAVMIDNLTNAWRGSR